MIASEIGLWDKHWEKRNLYNLRPHYSLIRSSEILLEGFLGRSVLEVGSGRAVDSIEMAKRGANCVIVDFNKASFSLSQTLAKNSGVKITPYLTYAQQLPFADASFDLVFSQGLMEHPNLMESLPEQIRVTKPGGFILIDVPQLFSIQAIIKWIELKLEKWPYGPEINFTERELKSIIYNMGLKYVSSYGREFIPMVHLGIKIAFSRIKHGNSSLNSDPPVMQDSPSSISLFTRLELSYIGPKVLNNIGIIAQKPVT